MLFMVRSTMALTRPRCNKLRKLFISSCLCSSSKLNNTHIKTLILQGVQSKCDSSQCSSLVLHRTCNTHPGRSISSVCGSIPTAYIPLLIRQLSTNNEAAEMESWELLVDYNRLSPLEKKNHERHVEACRSHKEFYRDVATGYQVMTRHAHLKRGNCCGNACRHCPYGHKSVPPGIKPKTFNSAYYV